MKIVAHRGYSGKFPELSPIAFEKALALPIHGVQFHPESIATEHGHAMLANFLREAGVLLPSREREGATGTP